MCTSFLCVAERTLQMWSRTLKWGAYIELCRWAGLSTGVLRSRERVLTVVYVLVTDSCPTLRPRGLQPSRLLCPWDPPGKKTGVGCHFLLQGDCGERGIEKVSEKFDFVDSEGGGKGLRPRGAGTLWKRQEVTGPFRGGAVLSSRHFGL